MKATEVAEIGGPETLRLIEVKRPEPIPTEILVRVHAAGVNPVDWKTREGAGAYGVVGPAPFRLGWDVSGTVEAVGAGVTRFAVGDEVFGMPWFPREAGAYAEYVTAPSRQFALKPAVLSHAEAAALPLAALTAWQALIDTARISAGQRVLILAAAGGVGHLAVQIAKSKGCTVIGTARAAKHDFLASLGIDQAIDYTTTGPADATVPVDVILDLIGGETGLGALDTLRPGGTYIPVPSKDAAACAAEAAERGFSVHTILVEPDGHALDQLAALVDRGQLTPRIDRTFPLAEAADAHRYGQQGRTLGKIVLLVT